MITVPSQRIVFRVPARHLSPACGATTVNVGRSMTNVRLLMSKDEALSADSTLMIALRVGVPLTSQASEPSFGRLLKRRWND